MLAAAAVDACVRDAGTADAGVSDVGTAYDTGFTTAVDAQNRARSAGLNLYPSASSLSTQTYAQNLMGMYDKAEERKRDAIARTQKLFGTAI